MRAASWLGTAKPKLIKTHQVEPGGARGKIQHLTWGDLQRESAGEVSRGRSSDEGRESGWSEGPKNQGTELEKELESEPE